MNPFYSDTVPSLAGKPWLTMLTIIALLAGTILAVQWMHRIIGCWVSKPLPLSHPNTLESIVKLLIIFGALSRSIPRLAQSMAWGSLSPAQREWVSASSWYVNLIWATVFAVAWYLDRIIMPLTRYQLNQLPPPEVVEGLQGNKKRAIFILGLIVLIAFASVFLRPSAGASPPVLILG